MKKSILLFAILMALVSCSKKIQTDEIQTPAQQLAESLRSFQADGTVAFGHHDDPAYGVNWQYQPDSSDVKNVVGDYPAIFDWDLGEIELRTGHQIDGIPFDYMSRLAVDHASKGGVNSYSWHLRNPLTGGDAWDVSDTTVVAQCLADGAINDTIRSWIGLVADYFDSLRDQDGQRIPVIFRPWHEHTGSWFWWGADLCTPDDYKALWRLTRDVFDQKGLDNVVWVYSPGTCATAEEYMERYPGDEYVDVMGFDNYCGGSEGADANFIDRTCRAFDFLTPIAQEHGKVLALCEAGNESIPIADWFTRVLYDGVLKHYPIAYVTVWRNAYHELKPRHFYAPYPGHPAADDLLKFYQLPQTLFLGDMQAAAK